MQATIEFGVVLDVISKEVLTLAVQLFSFVLLGQPRLNSNH
jgi:hypothetical protein